MDWSKNAIDVLQALLTPVLAVGALCIGILNYKLAARRRKDELFDRRYKFYTNLRSIWLSTGTGAQPDEDPEIDPLDLIPIAEEANFLFGKDIADHVMSLPTRGHSGYPSFPDEDFIKPFRKYLSL